MASLSIENLLEILLKIEEQVAKILSPSDTLSLAEEPLIDISAFRLIDLNSVDSGREMDSLKPANFKRISRMHCIFAWFISTLAPL
jgi:hypothetical protein